MSKTVNEVTQEMIDDAIKNCMWLSQNRGGYVPDVCTGEVLPCPRCIEAGKCPTLKELFRKAVKG